MNNKLITSLVLVFLTACSQEDVSEPNQAITEPAAAIEATAPLAEEPSEPVYTITQLSGDLYHASSDRHNTLFLVTPEGTVLADPLNLDFAEWLKAELASRFNSTVRYVLYTHHHWDHASGGAAFADTAEFVGHENMIAALALPMPANYLPPDRNGDGIIQRDEAGGGLAVYFDRVDENGDGEVTGTEMNRDIVHPTITYQNEYSIQLGGKEVRMIYTGTNHSNDGSIIYFPEEATGLGADWLQVDGFPRTLAGAPLTDWIISTDRMAELDVIHVVPGHGQTGTHESIVAYNQFFRDLKKEVDTAIHTGMSQQELQQTISLPAYSQWPNYKSSLSTLAGEAYQLYTL